jgi:hypothetical protein
VRTGGVERGERVATREGGDVHRTGREPGAVLEKKRPKSWVQGHLAGFQIIKKKVARRELRQGQLAPTCRAS